jgi:hypothetical protein
VIVAGYSAMFVVAPKMGRFVLDGRNQLADGQVDCILKLVGIRRVLLFSGKLGLMGCALALRGLAVVASSRN